MGNNYDLLGIGLEIGIVGQKNATKDLERLIDQLEKMGIDLSVGVDIASVKKQLSSIEKIVKDTLKKLNIDDITGDVSNSLRQMFSSIVGGNMDAFDSVVDEVTKDLNRVAMISDKNIKNAKESAIEFKKLQQGENESVYNYFKSFRDAKGKWGKVALSEELNGVDGLKQSLLGLVKLTEQGGIGLDTLQKEMYELGIISKETLEKNANMQDFAVYIRDCITEYRNFKNEVKSGIKFEVPDMTNNVFAELSQAVVKLSNINPIKQIKKDAEDLKSEVDRVADSFDRIGKRTKTVDTIVAGDDGENLIKNVSTYVDELGRVQQITKTINRDTGLLEDSYETITNDNGKREKQEKKIAEHLQHQQEKLRENFEIYKKTFDNSVMKIENKYNGLYDVGELRIQKETIEDIQNLITNDLTESEIEQVNNQLKHVSKNLQLIQTQAQITSKGVKGEKDNQSWIGSYVNKFKNMFQYATLGSVFYEGKQLIAESIQNIRQLDTSLVELSKVSSVTRDEFGMFVKDANETGNAVGKTSKDVIDAVTSFQRAGYTLSQSKGLAEQALIMANISENMKDAGENATAIVNILKGYKMEVSEVSKVNDVFNEISNNMAVNFDTLVSSTREIAGVMNIYGNSLSDTAAMVTSIVEIMGTTGEETANALKTISLRLAGFNDEGEKDVQLVAKLNDEFQKIAKMSLTKANGQLKSTFEIVDEYSKKVKELNLSEETQAYLGEKIAGKHRTSYWMAMVQNFDSARKAMHYANDSLNSSLEEQEKYVQSLDGQIEILKSSLMSLSYNTINTDWVVNIVKATNEIVKLADKIGVANIAMGAFVGYLSAKSKMGLFNSLINNIVSMVTTYTTKMTGATATTIAFGTAMKAMTGVGLFAGVVAGVAIFDKLHVSTEEQKEKVSKLTSMMEELNGEYETLKNKQNPTQEEKERLSLLEKELEMRERILAAENNDLARKEVFGIGQIADSGLSVKGNVVSHELKAMSDAIDSLYAKLNSGLVDAEYIKVSDEIRIKTGKLLDKRDELALINDKLALSNKNLIGSENDIITKQIEEQQQTIKLTNERYVLSDTAREVVSSNDDISDSMGGVADSTSNASDELITLNGELSKLKDEIPAIVGNYHLLVDAIQKLTDGQRLSGDEIYALTLAYKDLIPKIDSTTGQMYLERDALIALADKQGADAQQGIMAQINKTKQVAVSTASRIGLMTKEVEAINSLSDAYRILAANATSSTGGYRPQGMSDEDWSKSATNMNSGINSIIKDLADLYKQAEHTASGIDKVTEWGDKNKKKSSSSSKLTDPFKQALEEIKRARQEIENEISVLQASIELDDMVGITDVAKLDQMTILLDKLRNATSQQVEAYSKLKSKFKKDEHQLELNDLISQANTQRYKDEQGYIEHTIQLLERKASAEKKTYEDKLKWIEIQKTMAGDDQAKLLELEQQKYDELIKMQESYLEKMRELKATGKEDDSKYIQDYHDMWLDAEQERLNMLKSMSEQQKQSDLKAIQDKIDALEKQKVAQKKIHEVFVDMIKKEQQEKKKAIQEEIDGYTKIINAKKKALRDEYDKENTADELQERQKVIMDLENQLLMLQGVDGEDAKKKRLELEEQLAKEKKDLDKFNRDQLLQSQEDALDKELENFKEEKNEELDVIDDYLSNEGKIREEAIKRMDKNNKKLYDQLKKYSAEYTDMSGQEFDELWKIANAAIDGNIEKNLSLLDTMKLVTEELKKQQDLYKDKENSSWQDNIPGGGNTGGGNTTNKQVETIKKMIENSSKWKTASDEEKKSLSDENQRLGNSIGAYYDSATGTWFTDSTKKKKLYSMVGVYHKGGIVGGNTSLKSTEEFAKLLKGEVVASIPQMDRFMNKTLPSMVGNNSGYNINLSIDKLLDVDKIDNTTDVENIIDRSVRQMMKTLNTQFRNMGLRPGF